MTWDITTPADTDAIRLGAGVIRTLKTDLQTALQAEGVFPGPNVATPIFRYAPPRGNTASRPASTAATLGRLYLNTDTGTVQRDRGDGTNWDDVATLTQAGDLKYSLLTADHAGWFLCDGRAVSRATYAILFAAIGVSCGSGDGSTTFNIPDGRGRFIRGVDGGTGNDPDAAARTAMNAGGNTGANVGSLQADQYASHTHTITDPAHLHQLNSPGQAAGAPNIGVPTGSGSAISTSSTTTGITINLAGGNETRPKNFYANTFIKY